jgi:hypothetical protein
MLAYEKHRLSRLSRLKIKGLIKYEFFSSSENTHKGRRKDKCSNQGQTCVSAKAA